MDISLADLPDDVASLKETIGILLREKNKIVEENNQILALKKNRIMELEELVRYLQNRRYAPSSERFEGMTPLFNEPEAEISDKKPEQQSITYNRKKPKRRPIPENIPRTEIEYDLGEEEKTCGCGGKLEPMGSVTSEQLDIIPAKMRVLRHIRKKYACPCCMTKVRTAKMPKQLIPGGLASPGLLAHIAVSKYADGLPLHRQESILRRSGVDIGRGSMSSWMIKLGKSCQPLINLMREDILSSKVLHVDETRVQVLKESGRKAKDKSYVWVLATERQVLFNYDRSRGAHVAQDLLLGYDGYLVTDGYGGYDPPVRDSGKMIHCGCWDHSRRKFHDVIKSRQATAPPGLADEALEYIGQLYNVDRQAGATPGELLRARHLYSRSIINHLRRWLDRNITEVARSSKLGIAMLYLQRQWPKLMHIFDDGAVPLSNARAENAIRPFVIGRKNWLFSDTVAGAEASCAIYSLVETCKLNRIDPYLYLSHIATHLPNAEKLEDYEALLPYRLQKTLLN